MAGVAAEELRPGQGLRIRTVVGETLEGILLTYDETSQCLLLQVGSAAAVGTPPSSRTVVFLKKDAIKELKTIPGGAANGTHAMVPPRFDLQALQAKEKAAIQKAEEEAELLRQGVSEEALELFTALSRTLPVAWDRSTIVVMGEVRIASPYNPNSVTGGAAAARDRVKMVLTRERERLRQNQP